MAKKVDSRRKGHSFEREIVLKINELLYINGIKKDGEIINVKRNLEQYQSKSLADINLPGFSIECKRYKKNKGHQGIITHPHGNLFIEQAKRFQGRTIIFVHFITLRTISSWTLYTSYNLT